MPWELRNRLHAETAYMPGIGERNSWEAAGYYPQDGTNFTGMTDSRWNLWQYDAQLMERLKDPAFEAQMMRDLDQKDLVCWCTQPNRFVRCHGHSLLREIGRRSKRPELYCS